MHEGEFFFLPNAWKGGSAKIFEKQGFLAIGTTSAGIAYSLGYEDGEKIKFNDVLRVTKEIMAVTNIPLTVDIERGYGNSLDEMKINIEDEETIINLRSNINMPINLFVHNVFNDTKKLNQIGLNRLSSGSDPVRTTLNKLINISTDFNNGECKWMLLHNFSYAAANKYFRER